MVLASPDGNVISDFTMTTRNGLGMLVQRRNASPRRHKSGVTRRSTGARSSFGFAAFPPAFMLCDYSSVNPVGPRPGELSR